MNWTFKITVGTLLARIASGVMIAVNTIFTWQKTQSVSATLYFMFFMSSFWYLGLVSRSKA